MSHLWTLIVTIIITIITTSTGINIIIVCKIYAKQSICNFNWLYTPSGVPRRLYGKCLPLVVKSISTLVNMFESQHVNSSAFFFSGQTAGNIGSRMVVPTALGIPVHLLHLLSLHLADHVYRERLSENKGFRDLETRQLVPTPGRQLVG